MAEIRESPKPFGDITKENKGHSRKDGTCRMYGEVVSYTAKGRGQVICGDETYDVEAGDELLTMKLGRH